MFRSLGGGSLWPSRPTNPTAVAAPGGRSAGTHAVERAVNGAAAATGAAGGGARANNAAVGGTAGGAGGAVGSLGAVEGGDGGGGGAGEGEGDGDQGRILFYHKPTLAYVPAGDVPDVVPVYIGCPGGGMALGLPLNEAWQGGEHQVGFFCGGEGAARVLAVGSFY